MDYEILIDNELNELAAKAMGWHKYLGFWEVDIGNGESELVYGVQDWKPTADLNQTRMLADYIANFGFSWGMSNVENDHYHAYVKNTITEEVWLADDVHNPARALVEACLKAMGQK